MKRSTAILALIAVLLLAVGVSTAVACGGDKVSKLVGVTFDRCMEVNATLAFECPGREDRTFITISREDGRELYETLKNRYEPK
jgi:hypothetical protein